MTNFETEFERLIAALSLVVSRSTRKRSVATGSGGTQVGDYWRMADMSGAKGRVWRYGFVHTVDVGRGSGPTMPRGAWRSLGLLILGLNRSASRTCYGRPLTISARLP